MKAFARKGTGLALLLVIFCSTSSFAPLQVTGTTNNRSVATSALPVKTFQKAFKKLPLFTKLAQDIKQAKGKRNTGTIILVLLAALVVTALVALGIGILAWGGVSEVLVAIAAVVALGLIVWGTISIIKSINSHIHWVRNKLRAKRNTGVAKAKAAFMHPLLQTKNVSKPF